MSCIGSNLQSILYIEDDAALARLLQKRMERAGFNVDIAASAEEGFSMLQEQAYDLVLLDYRMPGKNGVQVYQDIRAAGSDVPVILVTAMNGVAAIAAENGIALFLEKPFGIDELLAIIKRTGLAGRAS